MKNKNHTFNIGDFVMHKRTHNRDPFWYGTVCGFHYVNDRKFYLIDWTDNNHKPSPERAENLIWVA
jgi:hypothetical protein